MKIYQRGGKHALDVTLALAGLALVTPVLVIVAIALRATMGSPILFRETRAGRDGVPFDIVKFRTMRDGSGSDGERTTRLGAILRATSIDELPQLINVVQGQMALVGPRPLPVRYVERYSPEQRRRLDVRPGITGLAQVQGRNQLPWHDRFRLDCEYVESISLAGDVRILARTAARVVMLRDVDSPDQGEAMPEFEGPQS